MGLNCLIVVFAPFKAKCSAPSRSNLINDIFLRPSLFEIASIVDPIT